MSKTYAVKGDWNAICDVCGFKYKASQLKKRWDNLMVCKEDFETRHPSDLYRAPMGKESVVPWTRPEPEDVEIDTSGWVNTLTCAPFDMYAVAGEAIAGCAVTGTFSTGQL
jgi:hypothetical protein